jgi:hypothetical protein
MLRASGDKSSCAALAADSATASMMAMIEVVLTISNSGFVSL